MTKKQLSDKKYRESHKQQIAISKKLWYENNRVIIAKKRKLLYEINKDQINAERRLKNENNPEIRANQRKMHAAKISIYNKIYRKQNPGIIKAIKAKRRSAKLNCTPLWLTPQDWEKIEEYYIYASLLSETLGILHEVDHIIPLQNKIISGLHCPQNLQILTKKENNKKKNKFPYKVMTNGL